MSSNNQQYSNQSYEEQPKSPKSPVPPAPKKGYVLVRQGDEFIFEKKYNDEHHVISQPKNLTFN